MDNVRDHICNLRNEGPPSPLRSYRCRHGLDWDKSFTRRVTRCEKEKGGEVMEYMWGAHTDQCIHGVRVGSNKDEWRVEGSWGQDLGAGENSHFLLTSVCTLAPDTTSRSRPDWSKVEDVGYSVFCCVFWVETELKNTELQKFDG